jgi:DNA-binding protein HU-beta
MNKAQLIEQVQKALGGETSKRAAGDALEAVLNSIAKGVKKGPVQLIGFGTSSPSAAKPALAAIQRPAPR